MKGQRYCWQARRVCGFAGVSAAQSMGPSITLNFLLDLHAQLAVDVVANAGRQQDALEGEKICVLHEVFCDVPTDEVAKLVIDADFVGLMRAAVDGLEMNAFGGAAEECRRGDGVDRVGLVETSDEEGSQGVQFQDFRRRRLVLVLNDFVREMNTDGVVVAENGVVALNVAGNGGVGGAILSGAVEAVGAKCYVQPVVGHEVVGVADGIGALHEADGFHANGHVLRAQVETGGEQKNREKAKCAEERWHGPSWSKGECTPKGCNSVGRGAR